MKKTIVLCLFITLLLVTSCTPTTSEGTEQTEIKEDSMPTKEPTPYTIDFVVTFDGKGCTSEGPSEVTTGEYVFKFIDKSKYRGELWLIYIDEGKTFQDQLDLQSEPGDWYPKPSWNYYGYKTKRVSYEETDEGKVEISIWNLKNLNDYSIMCYVDVPRKLWWVNPIFVVETLSD